MASRSSNRVGGGAAAVISGSKGAPKSKPPAGSSALLQQMRQAAESADVTTLPRFKLAKIAPHPDNPKRRSNPNAPKMLKLKKSIEEHDFLQPLTLASRADVVEASPELAAEIDEDAEWVSLIGHRRTVAGLLAGKVDAPAIIRRKNLSRGEIAAVFYAENKDRDDITPIEEAETFARMMKNGYKQETVAETLGVSQAHVAKTLALLDLPEILIEAINDDQLNRADAGRLLKLSKSSSQAALDIWRLHMEELAEIGEDEDKSPTPIATLINRQRAAADKRAREEDLRAIARENGIELLSDEHPVAGLIEIAANDALRGNNSGLVGARVADGRITYLARPTESADESKPVSGATDSGPSPGLELEADASPEVGTSESKSTIDTAGPADKPQVTPAQEALRKRAEAASRQRAEACRLLLHSEMPPSAVDQILIDGALYATSRLDTKAAKVVSTWLDRKIHADRDVETQVESKTHRQKVALAVVLAAFESEASRSKYDSEAWPPYIRRHVSRLKELGHLIPDPFDDGKLDVIDQS